VLIVLRSTVVRHVYRGALLVPFASRLSLYDLQAGYTPNQGAPADPNGLCTRFHEADS
jgi:hypothetical protein